MGEGGFPGTGNSGEADEKAEWDLGVELADVVAGRACYGELRFAGLAAVFWDGDGFFAVEPRQSAE